MNSCHAGYSSRFGAGIIHTCALVCMGVIAGVIHAEVSGSWPAYFGDGDYVQPRQGIELVEEASSITLSWRGPGYRGMGKGMYGDHKDFAEETGSPLYFSGTTTPIVAENKVFFAYYSPAGEALISLDNKGRTYDTSASCRHIVANDNLIAIDAETGDSLWQVVEEEKGMQRADGKRVHWAVTPVYHNGTVYVLGTTGILYAYRAEDGEKLWEEPVQPMYDYCMQVRAEAIAEEKRPDISSWKSSLIVSDGVLVVPISNGKPIGLRGVNPENGDSLWQLDEVMSQFATPSIWHNEGKEYLFTGDANGAVHLIDPVAGTVLWSDNAGPNHNSLIIGGDYAIFNSVPDRDSDGLYGCYKLSRDGMQLVWRLPDDIDYMHKWSTTDNAHRWVAFRGDIAIVIVKPAEASSWEKHHKRLMVIRVADGEILYDYRFNMPGGPETNSQRVRMPIFMEDHVMLMTDQNHCTSGWGAYYYKLEDDNSLTYAGAFPTQHLAITGYEVPIEIPYVDGRIFFRSMDGGISCYDLRSDPSNSSKPLANDVSLESKGLLVKGSRLTLYGSIDKATSYRVIDQKGRVIRKGRIGGTTSIDLSNLPHGVYVAEIGLGNGRSAIPFVLAGYMRE